MTGVDRSPQTAARVAGAMLLLLMAVGLFSQGYVPSRIIVAGDVAATAHNIVEYERLFRVAMVTDVLVFAGDIVMAVAFYLLLRRVAPGLALTALLLRTAQSTIMAMNGLSLLAAASALTGPGNLSVLGEEQVNRLANAYVGTHTAGFSLGLALLGIGNAVFAYLLLVSGYVPKPLAAWGLFANGVLVVGCLAVLVAPSLSGIQAITVGRYLPVFFFEVITGGYLLLRGARITPAAGLANPAGVMLAR